MGKEISWDEKVRVSALRAACASTYEDPYDPVMVRTNGPFDYSSFSEFDGRMTERILERAAIFERWLVRNGYETIPEIITNEVVDVEA